MVSVLVWGICFRGSEIVSGYTTYIEDVSGVYMFYAFYMFYVIPINMIYVVYDIIRLFLGYYKHVHIIAYSI